MEQIVNNDKMSSLTIAEISNRRHDHLIRDIRNMQKTWTKLGQPKFGESSYINAQNRKMPMFLLTKTECLYIATKFNDEARARLVLRWQKLEEERNKAMDPLDMVQASINAIKANRATIDSMQSEINYLKAKTATSPDYFTIAGFGRLNGVKVNIKLASRLGREASKVCNERGIPMDEIPDPRFGKVKMYPRRVLDEVFNSVTI